MRIRLAPDFWKNGKKIRFFNIQFHQIPEMYPWTTKSSMEARLRTVAPKGRLVEIRGYPIGTREYDLRPIEEVHSVGNSQLRHDKPLGRMKRISCHAKSARLQLISFSISCHF